MPASMYGSYPKRRAAAIGVTPTRVSDIADTLAPGGALWRGRVGHFLLRLQPHADAVACAPQLDCFNDQNRHR
jgi:hypothetical protein